MVDSPGIVAWSLTALVLAGLLAGCAQQAPPTVGGLPDGAHAGTEAAALAAAPDDRSGSSTGVAGDDGSGSGAAAGPEGARAGGSGSGGPGSGGKDGPDRAPGRIEARLVRETYDRAAPMPARFAGYVEFHDASGREVKAPKDAQWTLLFSGDGMVRSAAGRSFPAFVEFEAANPGRYEATFTVQADGFRTATSEATVEAFGPTASRLIWQEDAVGTGFTFTGATIVYVPGRDIVYVDSGSGTWEKDATYGRSGTPSWRSNYEDATISNLTLPRLNIPPGGAVLEFWSRGGAESSNFDGLYVNAVDGYGKVRELARYTSDGPNWRLHQILLPPGMQDVQFQFRADMLCGDSTPLQDDAEGLCGNGYNDGGFWIDDMKVWVK